MTKAKQRIDWLNVGFWCAVACVLFFAGYGVRAAFGQGGFADPPRVSIVPHTATFDNPLVWWSIGDDVWVNASAMPEVVCINGESIVVMPSGVIIRRPDSCRAQCPPRHCAICVMLFDGLCYVDCVPYSPMNPWQWESCPETCRLVPGEWPTDLDPVDMDDDK